MSLNKHKQTKNRIPLSRGLKYGSIAGVFYFSIAFISNWGHSLTQNLVSSISHGLFCLIMTFISTSMMEYFFNKFTCTYKRYFFSFSITGIVILSVMTAVHILIKTPEIFNTVFYSALASLPYYLIFPLKLIHEHQQRNDKFAYRKDLNWKRSWPVKSISVPYLLPDFFILLWRNITTTS